MVIFKLLKIFKSPVASHDPNFNTVEDLAAYLKYLDGNTTAYLSYFDWYRHPASIPDVMNGSSFSWCKLCEMLNDPTAPTKYYTDIEKWWMNAGECKDNDTSDFFDLF